MQSIVYAAIKYHLTNDKILSLVNKKCYKQNHVRTILLV